LSNYRPDDIVEATSISELRARRHVLPPELQDAIVAISDVPLPETTVSNPNKQAPWHNGE
jgi:hypothetical protein